MVENWLIKFHLSVLVGVWLALYFSFQVDLDLGNYERFLDLTLTRENNITTGKIYQVIEMIFVSSAYLCLISSSLLIDSIYAIFISLFLRRNEGVITLGRPFRWCFLCISILLPLSHALMQLLTFHFCIFIELRWFHTSQMPLKIILSQSLPFLWMAKRALQMFAW